MKNKRRVIVLTDAEENRLAEEYLNDGSQEKWETGELGRDPRHAVVSPSPAARDTMMSLRMPSRLKAQIARKARAKGLSVNAYIRMLLIEHIEAGL